MFSIIFICVEIICEMKWEQNNDFKRDMLLHTVD
jgi:hypothetical protein